MTRQRKLAYIALLLNALIWGAAIPIVKLTLPHTTPFRWLFYRYVFAAPISLPLLIYLIVKNKPTLKSLLQITGLELVGTTLTLALLYTGLNLTTSIEASLIAATTPIFITLAGIFFLREKQEGHEWLGLSLAFVGTLLITLIPVFSSTKTSFSLLGNALIFSQNIIWALYLVKAKKLYKNQSKLLITSISFWVGLVTFFVLSQIQNPTPLPFGDLSTPIVLIAALYMGIFGSIVATTLYLFGQNLIEASEASLFTYLHPLIAVPLSIILLQESIPIPSIIAIVVIVIGVFLAERKPGNPLKHPVRKTAG